MSSAETGAVPVMHAYEPSSGAIPAMPPPVGPPPRQTVPAMAPPVAPPAMPPQQIYGAPTTYGAAAGETAGPRQYVEAAPEPGVHGLPAAFRRPQDMAIRPNVLGKCRSKASMVRALFGLSALDASGWVKTYHLNGTASLVWGASEWGTCSIVSSRTSCWIEQNHTLGSRCDGSCDPERLGHSIASFKE